MRPLRWQREQGLLSCRGGGGVACASRWAALEEACGGFLWLSHSKVPQLGGLAQQAFYSHSSGG